MILLKVEDVINPRSLAIGYSPTATQLIYTGWAVFDWSRGGHLGDENVAWFLPNNNGSLRNFQNVVRHKGVHLRTAVDVALSGLSIRREEGFGVMEFANVKLQERLVSGPGGTSHVGRFLVLEAHVAAREAGIGRLAYQVTVDAPLGDPTDLDNNFPNEHLGFHVTPEGSGGTLLE